MASSTLSLPYPTSGVTETGTTKTRRVEEIVVVSALLCLFQVLDGIFTGIGMARFGTDAEGNLLLRALMEQIGYVPALILAKSAVIGIVIILSKLSSQISWLLWAMRGVTAVYFLFAILPWSYLLLL